mgnify:FL=1
MIYKITAVFTCKFCHGSGTVYDTVPYGSTTAQMPSDCDCVKQQLPEEFDYLVDEVEIVEVGGPIVREGPEFEYDDYLDLYD